MTTATTQEFPAELDPLTVESSNLMIEAKWLQAMGQPFDAAVAYFNAGRRLDLLGDKLAESERFADAVQELLYAAECYVEAGDYRPAEASLKRVTEDERLNKQLSINPYYAKEHARLSKAVKERQRQIGKAKRESWEKIQGDITRLDRLAERWLDVALLELPGVAEIHWITAERHWSKGTAARTGSRTLLRRAIEHYRYCTRLQPSISVYHLVLMLRLYSLAEEDPKWWKEATAAADDATALVPDDPRVVWIAGTVYLLRYLSGNSSHEAVEMAMNRFRRASESPQPMSDRERVTARCSLAICLSILGHDVEAETILREVSQTASDSPSVLARLLLSKRKAERQRFVSTNASVLLEHVDDESARARTMLAYAG